MTKYISIQRATSPQRVMAGPASSMWDSLGVSCKWLVDLGTKLHDALCPSVADQMQNALQNIADGGSTAVSQATSAAVGTQKHKHDASVSDKRKEPETDQNLDVPITNSPACKIALFDVSSTGLSDDELSGSPWVLDLCVFMWSRSENKTVLGTVTYRQGRRYTDLSKANEFQLIFARLSLPDQPQFALEQLPHWFTLADMTYIQKEPSDTNSPMQEFAHCN